MSYESGLLRVNRLPNGVIRIGPYLAAAAGLGKVSLPGSTALVDPLMPASPPVVEVADPWGAYDTIAQLFGEPIADAVVAREMDSSSRPRAENVAPVLSAQLRDIQRLGHLLWMATNAPWSWPKSVLTAELIVAADMCRDLLEEPEAVSEVIAAYAESMQLALAIALRVGTPATISVYADACRSISRCLPFTDVRWAPLIRTIEQVPAAVEDSKPTDLWATEELVSAGTPTAPANAAVDVGVLHTGSATANWTRNTAGVVARDEDTVTWTVEMRPDGAADVTVVAARAQQEPRVLDREIPALNPDPLILVLSDPGWAASNRVACSLHTPAWPLPLAEFVLSPYPATGALTGACTVRGNGSQALVAALRHGTFIVDVHDLGVRYSHLRGPAPTVDAARRWTTRALCLSRLALADVGLGSLVATASGAWRRAIALWRFTGESGDPQLAAERVRHCSAWLALLARNELDGGVVDPIVGKPVAAGDLDDPALEPFVAEVLMARDSTEN